MIHEQFLLMNGIRRKYLKYKQGSLYLVVHVT